MGGGGDINNGTKSGAVPFSADDQGFCLHWNNHQTNLLNILESLVSSESFVDCTIYVDNHVHFKAHRVVLAACSPYFQLMLQNAPQDNCSIILPGVQEYEMKTLLEFIYAGEVNIFESKISRIMKLGQMLEIKGFDLLDPNLHQQQSITSPPASRPISGPSGFIEPKRELAGYRPLFHSSPISTTSAAKVSSAHSSSSPTYLHKSNFIGSFLQPGMSDSVALAREGLEESSRRWSQLPLSLARSATSMLSSVYESGSDMNPLKRKKISSLSSMMNTRDTPILRNVLAQSNTADSPQQNPSNPPNEGSHSNENIEPNDSNNNENNGSNLGNSSGNNGSAYVGLMRKSSDRSYHSSNGSDNSDKRFKDDDPSSPYTDRSFEDEGPGGEKRTTPPEFLSDLRLPAYLQQHQLQQAQYHQQHAHTPQSGQGGSAQKPEWKRYKQYTRQDITAAIECVRNGMSALQASRKFGVPSRTLYDKVKKLGISTGTPRNRSSIKREGREMAGPSSSSAAFPYSSLGSAASAFGLFPNQEHQLSQSHQDFDSEYEELKQNQMNAHSNLLNPAFLQKALERGGGDLRDQALHALAAAAQAAQLNGLNQSGLQAHGSQNSSMLSKYMLRDFDADMLREERNRSNGVQLPIKNEPIEPSDEEFEPTERAENLSTRGERKSVSPQPSATATITTESSNDHPGVIVPPSTKCNSSSENLPPTSPQQRVLLEKSDPISNMTEPFLVPTKSSTTSYNE